MTAPPLARWLTSSAGSLKERALRGGVWLLIGDGLAKVAGLAKIAILGRLLAPADFGLMGIAMAVLKAFEHLTETGFNAALIQRRDDIGPYLDTVWSVQLVRSLLLGGALVAAAPLGAWFFDNPAATPVIRAVALVLVLRGLLNPAVVHLRKELEFRRLVLWRSSGVLVGLAVGVGVAVVERSAWALVVSVIAAQAAETIASYWALPFRPRLRLEWARAAELVRFGKWIFWANVLAFLGLYADSVAVGRLLGTAALGFYQMAYNLAMLPTSVIGAHVRGVSFPAFSRLSDAAGRRRAFLLTLGVVASVVVPVAAFVTVFGAPTVELVLGARWLPIAPALGLLVWAGAGTALSGIANSLFQAMGRPELVVRLALVQIGLWAIAFFPLVGAWGITGMAMAVTASTLLALVWKLAVAARMAGATGRDLAAVCRVPLAGTAPFVVASWLAPGRLSPALAGIALAALAVSGAVLLAAFRYQFGIWPRQRGGREGGARTAA